MEDPLIFFVGLFCFVLAIVGVVMTYLEFKNIELKKDVFNYQGTGAVQWLLGFPLLLLPLGFFYLGYKLVNFQTGIATLIVLGILGFLFHEKLMKVITKKYIEIKYKMVNAFDQDN